MAWLRHLALRCRDMERSRAFYEQVIGLRFVGYRPHGRGLDLSDGVNNITLIQQPETCRRQPLPEGEEFIHFGLVVDDPDQVWQRLRAWGATFVREDVKQRLPIQPGDRPPASYKVLDPDDNVVDITSNRQEWRGVELPAVRTTAD
ncbi:MAG: VOC family protein [Pirellulales bacterium]|nr:VOC family protein [Pirellulales bacterium]